MRRMRSRYPLGGFGTAAPFAAESGITIPGRLGPVLGWPSSDPGSAVGQGVLSNRGLVWSGFGRAATEGWVVGRSALAE